jgi:SMODS and SLOG-associating 2TM effector domain 1
MWTAKRFCGSSREGPRVPDAPRGVLPLRVLVGVTGHRALPDQPRVAGAVREALARLRAAANPGPSTEVLIDIVSPLAEGTDRLVASAALESPGAQLQAVLPLPRADYETDFPTADSREAFCRLLASASSIVEAPPSVDRALAYERVGRLTVDRCDVLLAVWDGKPAAGRGGTAEIVRYARAAGCPVLIITPDGEVRAPESVREACGLPGTLGRLDVFNAERVDEDAQRRLESRAWTDLRGPEERAADGLRASSRADPLIRVFARADGLALRYQRRHRRAGAALHLLAAAAVAAAAWQALFAPEALALAWVEAVCIAAVLGVFVLGARGRWHDRWIDYRRLAERCRAAAFLVASGIDGSAADPRGKAGGWAADWVVAAFKGLLRTASPGLHPETADVRARARWLADAWIERQIGYHREISKRHSARHQRLFVAGAALFALTCLAALLHALPIVPHALRPTLWFAAIVLPALGAAVAAIRTQREYHRSAARSAAIVERLESVARRLGQVEDADSLRRLGVEADDIMSRENDDWRAVVGSHPLEPPL